MSVALASRISVEQRSYGCRRCRFEDVPECDSTGTDKNIRSAYPRGKAA
jgi:hypothetical protein